MRTRSVASHATIGTFPLVARLITAAIANVGLVCPFTKYRRFDFEIPVTLANCRSLTPVALT